MPAYSKGDLSIEAYLVRVLAALCRQNGGEIRIKGELVDTAGEATVLMKSWDGKNQELVLSTSMGSFSEIFRVTPERQNQSHFIFPRQTEEQNDSEPKRPGSTILDDEKLSKLERQLTKRRVAAMIADEMKRKRAEAQ